MMLRRLQYELKQVGFDLCHPLHTSWYNSLIKEDGLVDNGSLELLPEPSPTIIVDDDDDDDDNNGKKTTTCNAILIGNTKHIWPIFIHWLSSSSMVDRIKQEEEEESKSIITLTDREALDDNIIITNNNPFDTFVLESIHQTIRRCCMAHPDIKGCELFWSSGKRQKLNFDPQVESTVTVDVDNASCGTKDNSNDDHCHDDDDVVDDEESPFLVSMQRVATTTGKYWLDHEATKLCVHPEYGTWMAFRTLVLFETRKRDEPPPYYCCSIVPLAPPPCPCPVSTDEIRMAKEIFDYALDMSSLEESKGYGTTINKSWKEVRDYLHDMSFTTTGSSWDKVPETLKPWIQLQDSISVGRTKWRYGEEQLLYHYTRDSKILLKEIKRIRQKM